MDPVHAILGVLLLLGAVALLWSVRGHQRNRRQFENLERKFSQRAELLSTLAHEIRTPLTVIRSSAAILAEDRAGSLMPDQERFVRGILSNAQRLTTLTENILAGLKIENWHETLRLRPTNVRRVVISIVRSVEPVLSAREQSIRYVFPSLLSMARADPEWIGQVLVNLIHNATKYTPTGGAIEITVNENEHFIVVSVFDNGRGIGDRNRPDLFARYVQEDPSAPGSDEGAGLGLAIVRRIVQLHGGEVHVASNRGHGTTVSFTLQKVINE